MNPQRLFTLLILLSTICGAAQAQNSDTRARKYSNEFLSIGIGGRALGMANAQVATVNDVTSGYWNPAGLTNIENNLQIGLMHSEYFAGIAKFDYGAVAIPLKSGSRYLGASLIRFGVDDIPNTLELINPDGTVNYDNIKSFSVADYAFLISYAQKLKPEGLSIGGNAKIIHRTAGSFATAWGFGIDLGAQYRVKNWRFGAMARDITSTFNAWSFSFTEREKEVLILTGNELPENGSLEITTPKIILGAAYNFRIKERVGITPEINFDVTTDGRRNVLISGDPFSVEPHLGLELDYKKIIFLRGGIGNIQSATDDFGEDVTTFQPNLGVGLKIKSVSLDYAYTDIGNQSEALYSHVFSLMIGFNKKKGQ